jgi:hypothetical protein
MPSFRDLKGRELEDIVDSRGPSLGPPEDPGQAMAERESVKAAMEKAGVTNRPRRRDREPHEGPIQDDLPEIVARVLKPTVPLPHDFEQGVVALEQMLDRVDTMAADLRDAVGEAVRQLGALRARAEQDADRLAKVDAALRVLQG